MKKLFFLLLIPAVAWAVWTPQTWDYYDGVTKKSEHPTEAECKAVAERDIFARDQRACRFITHFTPEPEPPPPDPEPPPPEPEPPPPEPEPPPPGSTLFSADFATYPDQIVKGRCRWKGDPECPVIPQGFDFIYTADQDNTTPPCEIKNGVFRVYDEGYGTASQWGHDCQLAKYFPQMYQPLLVRLEIRFEDGFNGNLCKIFRVGKYNEKVADGTTGTSIFNTNNMTTHGLTIGALTFVDAGQSKLKALFRGDDKYKLNSRSEQKSDPLANVAIWDGQWHVLEFGMQVNSGPGVYDGVFEVWLDGVKIGGENDIPYLNGTPSQVVTGLNMFTLGGNCDWTGYTGERLLYEIRRVDVSNGKP